MEFKVFKNENSKILKEYWITPSEWDALDKTTVQEGDIYHIVGTIDKGDLSADVNASLAKGDSSLQKPTATLAKESFVKVGIDGTQKFDESSYASLDADKTNTFYSANTFLRPIKLAKDTSYVEYGEQSSYKFRDNSKENAVATLNDLIEDDTKTYITFKGTNFPGNDNFYVDKDAVIDWGDGTIQTVTGDPSEKVSHTYSEENLYRIVISNLPTIAGGAFSDCLGISDVKLGSTVTFINGGAFQNTGISSITIPKTVTQMDLMSTFADCTKLKIVKVLSETPLSVQAGIFENSPIEKIIVPKSAVNAYKSATGWSTYADKIVYEVDSTDISDTSNFAKLSGNNTFSGSNTFTGMTYLKDSLVCQDEVSGLAAGFNQTGVTLETAGSSNTLNISVNDISHKVLDSNKIAVANTTLTFPTSTNGIATTVTLPNKTGTLALVSQIKTKTSQLTNDSGFTTNKGTVTKVKVNNSEKSPDTNGIVDLGSFVSLSGNNAFTGNNTFAKTTVFAAGIMNNSNMIISPISVADPTNAAPYAIYHYSAITLKAPGVTGADKVRTLSFPTSVSGVLALTSDIPIKSASLDGTTLNITLA